MRKSNACLSDWWPVSLRNIGACQNSYPHTFFRSKFQPSFCFGTLCAIACAPLLICVPQRDTGYEVDERGNQASSDGLSAGVAAGLTWEVRATRVFREMPNLSMVHQSLTPSLCHEHHGSRAPRLRPLSPLAHYVRSRDGDEIPDTPTSAWSSPRQSIYQSVGRRHGRRTFQGTDHPPALKIYLRKHF